MQPSPRSEPLEESATGRRVAYAIGLALIVGITSIATNRTNPVRTNTSTPSPAVSSAAAPQPLEAVEHALEKREQTVRVNVPSSAQLARRLFKHEPVFDNAARAELRESVRASMHASLTRLSAEFPRDREE